MVGIWGGGRVWWLIERGTYGNGRAYVYWTMGGPFLDSNSVVIVIFGVDVP